jgi:hypothetical protein
MVEMIRRSVPDASLTEVLEVLQRHAAAPSANLDDVYLERLIMMEEVALLESAGIELGTEIDDFLAELGMSRTGLRGLARARRSSAILEAE